MIPCDQKALTGRFVALLVFIFLGWAGINTANAQITPVTQYECDPRSTANGGTCPGGCTFATNVEKGCNCFDSVDNDGDGKIDAADISDCAQYFGLSFVGSGTSNCSLIPPGGNPFAGIGAPATSQQNTADTQSKVAAGDVTGDGVPEAVITSKWNNEVRVINPDGTVNASYNLSGKKSLFTGFTDVDGKKADPDRLLLEHEVLIADIKRAANQNPDGKGEIFAIVSSRGGNPKTPPNGFYLLALTWTKPDPNGLQLLYDPVPLGTNRPGIFGIADMDGDGFAELYLRDRIYAAETGKLLASEGGKTHLNTTLWDSDVTSAPVAVTVTGDNKMELICGTKIYTVPSLTNRNPGTPGSLTLFKDMNADFPATKCFVKLMNDPTEYGVDTHSSTSVADIDEDGFLDVVITGALNSTVGRTAVFYWNVQKNTVSYKVTPSSTEMGLAAADPNFASYSTGWIWGTGRVNIGDANGDGKPDLTFIAGNQLFCLTTSGGTNLVTLWTQNLVNTATGTIGYRSINDSRSGVLTATIYDFNNDGNPEMVYRDSQSLNIIDGATGQTTLWSTVCQSHTYTEGPIIADVNGDGATDICVTCNTSNKFDITDDIQQQALGQVRLYFSNGNTWLPTRKVWNQPGYFVVNINDDLTLPFPQLSQILDFGNTPCPNGIPGPNQPFNVFLNQVPYLNANGCPVFPAPDLTFVGDTPGAGDTDGDGIVKPAVIVTPPICGNLDITVQIRYGNIGDIPITDAVPVSFFKGDPRLAGAVKLHNTVVNIVNLQPGTDVLSTPIVFNGTGETFDLFIALYNDGSVLPISSSGQTAKECQINNNVYQVPVIPTPFTTDIVKFKDNVKCVITDPDQGELRARVFIGATEVFNFSPYAFQWYSGIGTTNPIPAAQGGTNPIITGLAAGDYTLVVTNTQKGCTAAPVNKNITLSLTGPVLSVVAAPQTQCSPPNGSIQANVVGGNTGFTFNWFNSAAVNLGITTSVANGLKADDYTVRVSRSDDPTCFVIQSANVPDNTQEPDAVASVVQNVVDCSTPNSGSVTAQAFIPGDPTPQNPAEYTFNWYFYNNVANTRGSILPDINGTQGTPTRTGLAAGFYQLEVIRNSTQCVVSKPPVQITNSTILPTAAITEVQPQTSCDPNNPNGILLASATAVGYTNPSDFTFEWFRGDNTLPENKIPILIPTAQPETVSGTKGETLNKVKGGGLTYTVRITTPLNCSATAKYIISENVHVPEVDLVPANNTICDAVIAGTNFNGSLSAVVTFNGSPVNDFTNYSFTWYDGAAVSATPRSETSTVLSNLNSAYYTLVVERTDLNCKSLPSTEFVDNAVTLPDLTPATTPATNCAPNKANGAASVTINNVGGFTYAYQWFNGNDTNGTAVADANGGKTSAITAVAGGVNYTVRVTNNNTGCRSTATTIVPNNQQLPILTLGTTANTICNNNLNIAFNGTAFQQSLTDANAIVGDTYTFQWSTGSNMLGIIAGATGSSITGRNGGFYSATVTNDRLGCTSTVTTTEILNQLVLPNITIAPTPSTNCAGGTPNGAASATIDVGGVPTTAGYTFNWFKGNTNTDPEVADADGGNTPNIIKLQGTNNFTVEVRNSATGCINTKTQIIADNSQVPVLSLQDFANLNCDVSKGFTGRLEGTVVSDVNALGSDTYTYAWSIGNNMSSPTGDGTSILNNRAGGFYTATVTNDRLKCVSNPVTREIKNNQLLPALTAIATPSTNCPGGAPNGTITVSVTNNALNQPMIFSWYSDNAATIGLPAPNNGNSTTASQLQGGINVFFTTKVYNDITGCENKLTTALVDGSVLPALALSVDNNEKCISPFDGSVSISSITDSNSPGADTYTVKWYTGSVVNLGSEAKISNSVPEATITTGSIFDQLDNGFYTVTVTNDRLNCTSNPEVREVLDNLTFPVINAVATASTNCPGGTPNGSANVFSPSVTGHDFNWYAGSTASGAPINTDVNDLDISGLQGSATSFYTVEVIIEATGCASTETVLINDDSELPVVAPLSAQNNKNCSAPFDGTATLNGITYRGATITFPNPAFTFDFEGQSTNQLTQLGAGTYTFEITHIADNCKSDPVSVPVLDAIVLPPISIVVTPQTSCNAGAPNGAMVATVNGGTAGHSFEWFNGLGAGATGTGFDKDNSISGKLSSDYTVRVINTTTRCESVDSRFLPDNIVNPSINFTGIQDVQSCDPPDGKATPVVTDLSSPSSPDFTIFYVRTFSTPTNPASAPTDPTVIKASPDKYSSTSPLGAGNPPDVTALLPGYLTAVVVDNLTTCESSPRTISINDGTSLNQINVGAITAAGFCGGNGGQIDVTVSGGVAPYTFNWYKGTPSNNNVNFFTNPPNMSAAIPITSQEDLGVIDPAAGVGAGTYTLVVNDAVGCGNFLIESVPFASAPTITVTPKNPERCDAPFDGEINVALTNVAIGPYSIAIYSGNSIVNPSLKGEICDDGIDNDGDGLTDAADPDCNNLPNLTLTGLAAGEYIIRVIDYTAANRPCPLDKGVVLLQQGFSPIVDINNISPNTACDDTNFADGSVAITVSQDPADNRAAAGLSFEITSVSPAPGNPPVFPNVLGTGVSTVSSTLNYGFAPQAYTLRVTETSSGCFADQVVVVPDQPVIPQIIDVQVTPETFCLPFSNGSAFVNSINPIDIPDYKYSWYADDALNTVIYQDNGVTGSVFNATKSGYAAGTLGSGYGNQIVYVRGERLPGTGAGVGCPTPAVSRVILDEHITPIPTLIPLPTTSCDPTVGEGSISITTVTNSTDPAVSGATYEYGINPDNNSVGLVVGNNGATPFVFGQLTQNSGVAYAVTAKNEISGCIANNSVTIQSNPYGLSITKFTFENQLICNPDGSIDVTEIIIDRPVSEGGPITFSTPTDLNDSFEFRWHRANPATPGIFDPLARLQDPVGPTNITEKLLTGSITPAAGEYNSIGAGTYYVIAERLNGGKVPVVGFGCETPPLRVDIADQHVNPIVTLVPFSNTACIGGFEGELDVDVSDASAVAGPFTFNYTWTNVTSSTTPGPLANPYSMLPGVDANFTTLQEGNYSIRVSNLQTGCEGVATTTIFKNATPIFTTDFNVTPQFYCEPSGNAEVTEVTFVDRNGIENIAPLPDFSFSWTLNGVSVGGSGVLLDSANYANIGAGIFAVVATRTANGPGLGCSSAPILIEIRKQTQDPIIALSPFSNTSCTTAFEGEIEVDITDNSEPKAAGDPDFGIPFSYNYTWSAISVANGLPANLTTGLTNPYTGGSDLFSQLEEGTYQLSVINTITGCSSTATTTISKNATPVFVQDVTMVPQKYCPPIGSGNLNVVAVTFNDRNGVTQNGPLGDFEYIWSRSTIGNVVATTDPTLPQPPGYFGTELDSLILSDIGADSYFVVARRKQGTPGAGCASAPFKVDITEDTENPAVTFTTIANTSCDSNFDGSITVLSSTQSQPGKNANYDIAWTSILPDPNFTLSDYTVTDATNVGSAYTTLLTDVVGPGQYTVRVTNRITQCFSDAVVTLLTNPQPVEIVDVTKQDQMICFADGSITVTTLNNGLPVDYTYNWFRQSPNSTPLVDGTNTTIVSQTINTTNYAQMGADTYFVVGTKNATSGPGSGCNTPPYRVDILDLHKDPQTQFTLTPNSSCSDLIPNGVVLATSSEQDASIDNYTFTWQYNNAALPPALVPVDVNNTSQISDAPDGTYTLTVFNTITGCQFTSDIDVIKDLSISLPNIITVDKIEPTTCIGDGSALVTGISIGGGPTLTGAAIDPPVFEYEWHAGSFPSLINPPVITPGISNLATGKYYVLVKDVTTECKSAPTEVVLDDLNIIYPTIEVSLTTPQISCDNSVIGTGVLQAEITQDNNNAPFANPDYTYTWFNNLDYSSPAIPPSPTTTLATINSIVDLKSGDYSLTVFNSKTGCTSKAIYIVPDNAPQFQPKLALSASERTLCNNLDGMVAAGVIDISPQYPFSYDFTADLYFGDVVNNLPPVPDLANIPNVVDPSTNNVLEDKFSTQQNLAEGFYTVRVTDNNTGCATVKSIEVKDGRKLPVVDIVAESPNINCDDALASGQLSATADGNQVAGYIFDWYSGSSVPGPPPLVADNNRLIGFTSGDYTVQVTNELTGCVSDKTGTIVDGRIFPPAPTATVVRDRTDCLVPNGWVTANVGGLTINHIFNWYDGTTTKPTSDFVGADYFDRDIGPYSVTATDIITKCVSQPATVNVKDARVIPVVEITSKAALCLTPTGMVSLTLINNQEVTLADITWYDDQSNAIVGRGPEVYELTAGDYTAEFISTENCEGTASTVIETEILSYNLVSVNGDAKNDTWIIDCLEQFPGNNVKVFNRSGVKVYEADGYNNNDVVFRGIGENGVYFLGDQLPDGTYFYIIDKRNGSKPITGYLELVR